MGEEIAEDLGEEDADEREFERELRRKYYGIGGESGMTGTMQGFGL